MGKNSKKNLRDLRDERLKIIQQQDMNSLIGGKTSGKARWKSLCGGIIPQ